MKSWHACVGMQRRVRLVVSDVRAEQRRAVHPAKRVEHTSLVDDETPGEFAVYVLDQQARRERCLGHLPGETLARLLACLPDGAGPDGVALAFCCYRVGVDAGRAPDG